MMFWYEQTYDEENICLSRFANAIEREANIAFLNIPNLISHAWQVNIFIHIINYMVLLVITKTVSIMLQLGGLLLMSTNASSRIGWQKFSATLRVI